jgi:hypothetical protein
MPIFKNMPTDFNQPLDSVKKEDNDRTELVKRSRHSVEIETLQAGTMGLPTVAGPIYDFENLGTCIANCALEVLSNIYSSSM